MIIEKIIKYLSKLKIFGDKPSVSHSPSVSHATSVYTSKFYQPKIKE